VLADDPPHVVERAGDVLVSVEDVPPAAALPSGIGCLDHVEEPHPRSLRTADFMG
jgi:hypothetical protein